MTLDINLIIGLVGILSTLSMIVLGLVKFPAERKKLNADTVKGLAEAAKISEEAAALSAIRATKEAAKLDEYKACVEARIVEMENKIQELERINKEKDEIIEALQDWAERLVYQVKSLGGVPVPLKQKRKVDEKDAKTSSR